MYGSVFLKSRFCDSVAETDCPGDIQEVVARRRIPNHERSRAITKGLMSVIVRGDVPVTCDVQLISAKMRKSSRQECTSRRKNVEAKNSW
jgi:hypothetical protein